MNILERILISKKKELLLRKDKITTASLEKQALFSAERPSFYDALNKEGPSVIAEFKRKSPSKGTINNDAEVGDVSLAYEKAGARAISVLTDRNFAGNDQDLAEAFNIVKIPLLRKDFIIDEYQIIEARSIGASAILLIASVLSREKVKNFSAVAKRLGLDVLFEIHKKEDLEKLSEDIRVIGINNRNLETFEVNIENSLNIGAMVPDQYLKVSESGLSDPDSLIKLHDAGFDAFLIGEGFMKSVDPGYEAEKFIRKLMQKV